MKTKVYVFVCVALAVGCSDTIEAGDAWAVDENAPVEDQPNVAPDTDRDRDPDPDPTPTPFPSDLTGNWAQPMIGNCIDFTTWLVFGDDSELEYILADRNACAPHALTIGTGSWSQTRAHELEYEWRTEDQWERRRSTFEIRGDSLNFAAYERTGDVFVHQNEREGTLPGYYMHKVRVEVSFGEPLADPACNMHVEIEAEVDLGANAAPITASEPFDFACEKLTNDVGSFVIVARSSGERASDRWSDVFNEHDIWDRYDPVMADLIFRSFRPELNLSSPAAETAFMPGIWDAVFNRRSDEPPRTIEELDGNN